MSLSFLLDSKTAACVNEVIHELYTALQGGFKTIFSAFIPDNGTEFCQLNNLAEAASSVFFARPYTFGKTAGRTA